MKKLEIRSLTKSIKNEALRLGFQLVGVTTPNPPPHLNTYLTWLERGHYAGMKWMGTERARQCRADPLKILPSCKSILVLGIRYPKPVPHKETHSSDVRIASYALGDDYHDILPVRLSKIVDFIEDQIGKEVPNRWYTDTGPILERDLAQRAGLGWIGKNSCLINPQSGSYFLLAEILLGIDLEFDAPFEYDYCGSCNRCIEQCPTGCINSDRTINSNDCISYLTIEHKGFIPDDLRQKIGNWLFGCDICQIVCPWNRKFADDHSDPAFNPQPEFPPTGIVKELSLTPQIFNQKFKGSPIKRSKRRGYLRNVAIVIGNLRDHRSVDALCATLKDPDELIRVHSAWALGQIGGGKARRILSRALPDETHPEAKVEIQKALRKIDNCSQA